MCINRISRTLVREFILNIRYAYIDVFAGTTTANVDSARGNLAGTFVNAFVNAGFGNDKLMVEAEEGNSWIYKNKDHGMMSAAASLGLSLLWDTDIGLSHVDKYTYSSEEHIKVMCPEFSTRQQWLIHYTRPVLYLLLVSSTQASALKPMPPWHFSQNMWKTSLYL